LHDYVSWWKWEVQLVVRGAQPKNLGRKEGWQCTGGQCDEHWESHGEIGSPHLPAFSYHTATLELDL